MGAFRVPRLKEDDLPEATALSAQIELVAVKFSGVRSTTAGPLAPLQKNPAGCSLNPLTPLTIRR